MTNWWERTGSKASYPNLVQGNLRNCVYAAIAGAVNHLMKENVWTVESLFSEYQKNGPRDANFNVADTAIGPCGNALEKIHHNRDWSKDHLSSDRIREWIEMGAVVILSMELRRDAISKEGGWHMFSLFSYVDDRFQVWDTNNYEGFLTSDEISNGFCYPDQRVFIPHDREDALILKLRNDGTAKWKSET
jgi:hypothetical protein